MVFTLHYDNHKIHLTFLDGYWKLPIKSLEEKGSLTEKTKSKISKTKQNSGRISEYDLIILKSQLSKVLPSIYFNILKSKERPISKKNAIPPITFLKRT